jgi:hypothetical protein
MLAAKEPKTIACRFFSSSSLRSLRLRASCSSCAPRAGRDPLPVPRRQPRRAWPVRAQPHGAARLVGGVLSRHHARRARLAPAGFRSISSSVAAPTLCRAIARQIDRSVCAARRAGPLSGYRSFSCCSCSQSSASSMHAGTGSAIPSSLVDGRSRGADVAPRLPSRGKSHAQLHCWPWHSRIVCIQAGAEAVLPLLPPPPAVVRVSATTPPTPWVVVWPDNHHARRPNPHGQLGSHTYRLVNS